MGKCPFSGNLCVFGFDRTFINYLRCKGCSDYSLSKTGEEIEKYLEDYKYSQDELDEEISDALKESSIANIRMINKIIKYIVEELNNYEFSNTQISIELKIIKDEYIKKIVKEITNKIISAIKSIDTEDLLSSIN